MSRVAEEMLRRKQSALRALLSATRQERWPRRWVVRACTSEDELMLFREGLLRQHTRCLTRRGVHVRWLYKAGSAQL